MRKRHTRTARLLLATFGFQAAATPTGMAAQAAPLRPAAPVHGTDRAPVAASPAGTPAAPGARPLPDQRKGLVGQRSPQGFQSPAAVATTAIARLWPPEYEFVDVGLRVVATDPSGERPTAVLEVWSDEPEDAGPPVHAPDVGLTQEALKLRSERLGTADGRVYLLLARVRGRSGETHTCATVTVPHDDNEAAIALVNAQALAARTHCEQTAEAPESYLLLGSGPFEVSDPQEPVTPLLECVMPLPNRTFAAVFGYENRNPVPVPVPIGPENGFEPVPVDRGQPRAFLPGRSPAPGAFHVEFTDGLTWSLRGITASATPDSLGCEAAPETPEAQDDAATTSQGQPVTVPVLANDSDPQGDALRVDRVGSPSNGTAVVGEDGSITYTPAPSFHGADLFTYTVTDGTWGTDQAVVTVTVTPANQAPHVDAGPDLTITLPTDLARLNGTVADDGLPPPGTLQSQWSQIAGPGGVTFQDVTAAVTDARFPVAGQYTLRLLASDGALSGSDDVDVIVRPSVVPSVTINDAVVSEGQDGTTEAEMTLSLSEPAAAAVSIDYATLDGTASSSCDYLRRSGTVVFAPGETSAAVHVPVVGDLAGEANETLRVHLGNPVGGLIARDEGQLTIQDDDSANAPPLLASLRTPVDGADDVPASPTLQWSASDPEGHTLTYDVSLGTSFGTGGQTWRRLCPAALGPAPRGGTASAYSEASDTLLVFGGATANAGATDETWALRRATADGGSPQWSRLVATPGPAARQRATAAYVPSIEGLVVHGGCDATCDGGLADTWRLSNAEGNGPPSWTALPSAPIGRWGHAAAYDPRTRRLIVFGGRGSAAGDRNDVWVLTNADGSGTPSWVALQPIGTPPAPRHGMSASYDAVHNRLIVFGGRALAADGVETVFGDVWVLTNANGAGGVPQWNALVVAGPGPAARWGHAAAYDPIAGRLVVFGGTGRGFEAGTNVVAGDAWLLLDLAPGAGTPAWAPITAADGPAGRFLPASGYSVAAGHLVIAHGLNNRLATPLPGDLWTLQAAAGSLPLAVAGLAASSFAAGPLTDGQTYYWRLVARDPAGARASAPPSRFQVGAPVLSAADAEGPEQNAGAGPLSFTLRLSRPSEDTVSAAYATADGTATAGADFQATSGTVVFAPGVTEQIVQVPFMDDTLREGDETLRLVLTAPVNARLARPEALGVIRDDEPPVAADLVVSHLDTSSTALDGQTLGLRGTAGVEIANLGQVAAGPFALTLFDDLDGDGQFDPSADTVLGGATITELAGGGSVTSSVPLSGTLRFAGAPLFAFADSSGAVAEADETNNVASSMPPCEQRTLQRPWELRRKWDWRARAESASFAVGMTPAVADLDGDGAPEVVFSTCAGCGTGWPSEGKLRAVDGRTGAEKFTVTDPAHETCPGAPLAIGDIDGDGRPEIVAAYETTENRVIAFGHDGTFKWLSPVLPYFTGFPSAPAIANIDGQGPPEILYGGAVLNADGTLRWSANDLSQFLFVSASTAADVDLDGRMEVLAGPSVRRHDGTLLWRTPYATGYWAAGQFDADAFPELIYTNGGSLWLYSHDGRIVWGPKAISVGAPPSIGDLDRDGRADIVVVGGGKLSALRGDGTLAWQQPIVQNHGSMAAALFDLDGDGAMEIVFRDEVRLRVYRGSDGAVFAQLDDSNWSVAEMPVVADVDGNGRADIVFGSNAQMMGLHAYQSVYDEWASARPIWNQYEYHVTNVNDDVTIPAREEPHWTRFNTVRGNVPTAGCSAGRADLTASYLRVAGPPEARTLTVRIGNGGRASAVAGVPISFYDGDPGAGGVRFALARTASALAPGHFEDVGIAVGAVRTRSAVWVVADDAGGLHGIVDEWSESNNAYDSGLGLGDDSGRPDLAVTAVDASAVAVDPQALALAGTVSATVTNLDPAAAAPGFSVLFFEDRDGDGSYGQDADAVLGTATVGGLAPSESVTVSAPVTGAVSFAGAPVLAFADSLHEVGESREDNNVGRAGSECSARSADPFDPRIEMRWTASPNLPASNRVQTAPAVGDLDGDAVPDIVFATNPPGQQTTTLRAIRGSDGSEMFTAGDPALQLRYGLPVTIGDLEGDGSPEILGFDGGLMPVAFDRQGRRKWRATGLPVPEYAGSISLADLDGDGQSEVLAGRMVFNSNGALRWVGSLGGYAAPATIAADLDLDGSPEVIAGNTAYRANGAVYWQQSANGMIDGQVYAAVGEFDLDPFPEIVFSTPGRLYLLEHDGTIKWGPIAVPGLIHPTQGTPVTVADFDGDGRSDIAVGPTVVDAGGAILWSRPLAPGHGTAAVAFDFDADGTPELVVGDRNELLVLRGHDGVVLARMPLGTCVVSATYPVVADTDGDGNAELLGSQSDWCGGEPSFGLWILGDRNDRWAATRPVWNQVGYHLTNVGADLRIPRRQKPNWIEPGGFRLSALASADREVAPPASAATPPAFPAAAPDLAPSALRREAEGSQLRLRVRVGNGGAAPAGRDVPVAFYDGDPAGGGALLGRRHTLGVLRPGQFEEVDLLLPGDASSAGTVWVAVDRIEDGGGLASECNEANNTHDSGLTLNRPPSVSAGEDQVISLPANTVTLAGSVEDDGLPVGSTPSSEWSRVSGPGPVTFGNAGSPATTAQFTAAGTYVLRLMGTDGSLSASDEVAVIVTPPNEPPVVSAGPDQTITLPPTSTVNLAGIVTDDGVPAGVPVAASWTQVSGPATVAFGDPSSPATSAIFSAVGTYVLRLTATDTQLTASDDVTVTVLGGNRPPSVSAGADQAITLPLRTVHLAASVSDDGLPAGSSVRVAWTMAGGPEPAAFSAPASPETDLTFAAPGTYVLRITASDGDLSAADDVAVTVNPADPEGDPPVVSLSSPSEGIALTAQTPVTGSVASEHLLSWKLQSRRVGTADWSTVATGAAPVQNALLGVFDPSLALNGVHELRLSALDLSGRTAATSVHVIVRDQLKVGQFSLAFVDLEVPVAGTPIRLSRVYDSRDKGVGEFGFGWRLELAAFDVAENATAGVAWQSTVNGGAFPSYCLSPVKPLVVTVTDPGGHVHEFETVVTPQCQVMYPVETVRVSFRPRPGTVSSLAPLGGDEAYVFASWPGAALLYSVSTLDVFDPQAYRLTLPDGRAFDIDEAAGLQRLRDLMGNTLVVTRDGITSSNPGVPGSTLGVAFMRDSLGRIQAVTDPEGRSLTYAYDSAGDLVAVTDRTQHTTRFTYATEPAHHLVGIEDPLGRQPIRNEYYPDGRIKSHTDAFGNTITYAHELSAGQEIITDRLGQTRVLEYDARGNVVKETQPDGRIVRRTFDARNNRLSETEPHESGTPNPPATTYAFDGLDRMLSFTDPLGHRTSYTYNALNEVLTSTDPRGHLTENRYDGAGNLLGTKDALGNESTFTYDTRGNVLTQTAVVDGTVEVTRYEYDPYGNLLKETDPLGHSTTYTYDRSGNRLTQTTTRTTSSGTETLVTRNDYDAQGRLTKTTDPDGTSTSTVYDALGRQLESYDKLGRKTSFTYDEMGRLVKTAFPDGTFEESGYDAEGRRTTSKDRAGRTTSYEYDALGRLRKTTFSDGTFTLSAYDAAGRLTASTDARGHSTAYEYDTAGRRTLVRDALGRETVFGYDEAGNQTSVRDARGNTTTYEYDPLGRRTRTVFPDATFTSTGYDSLGRRVSETDQAGRTTRFRYDALGRLTAVTDALNQETRYQYDEVGNRTAQTDARGRVTRFEFDKLGREVRRSLPAVGGAPSDYETKEYDDAGNLRARRDLMGRTTSYEYDLTGRLLFRRYPDTSSVGFTYSPTGRRLTATDSRGTTSYGYDGHDRLASIAYPDGRRLEFKHDEGGNRTKLTAVLTALSLVTNYTFDELSRLATVEDPAGRVSSYSYDRNGNRESLAQPNGALTAYDYDDLNRLTSLTTTHPARGVTIQSYAFTLGPSGNRTAIAEADGTVRSYTYDVLYRLTGEATAPPSGTGRSDAFTYDAVGNRLTRVTVDASGTRSLEYAYDERDRLLSDGTGYDHDANGNLITKAGEATYTWDFENRLVRVTKTDGTVVEHAYDADGNRVRTSVTPSNGPPVVTDFLVDTSGPLSQVVAETDGLTGALRAYYVRGDDLLAVMRPLVPVPASPPDWQTRYYHADGIGSVRTLTDESGAVTDTYTYTAFGELLSHTGTDPQPYAFAGEPYDPNAGFQYHRARWMDPTVGRFLGMDPFAGDPHAPRSLHRYLYVGADPVNRFDPTGQVEFTLLGINFSVSISNVLRAVGQVMSGTVFGAIDGGLRATLRDEDWVVGALKGAQIGTLLGPLARLKRAQPYLISIGTALAGRATFHAYLDDNSGLALYNGILFVGGATTALTFMTQTSTMSGPVLVYRSTPHPTTGEVTYVGITQNFQARAATHLRTKGIDIERIGQMQNLSRDDARAVEQALIEFYGLGKNGGTLMNKINSIAQTDPAYSALLARGQQLLRQANYPGI